MTSVSSRVYVDRSVETSRSSKGSSSCPTYMSRESKIASRRPSGICCQFLGTSIGWLPPPASETKRLGERFAVCERSGLDAGESHPDLIPELLGRESIERGVFEPHPSLDVARVRDVHPAHS